MKYNFCFVVCVFISEFFAYMQKKMDSLIKQIDLK